MAKTSPTQKALRELKAMGYLAEKVEQRLPIPGKFVTRDLFGCVDIVGMKAGVPLLAVQATSRSNVNARMEKSSARAREWVTTGNRFQVRGYGGVLTHCRIVEMDDDGQWHEVSEGPWPEEEER